MASATIADHGFPPGTSVDAYPAQNQVAGQRPAGTATATATVAANGALTFNGLAEKISYVAWAQGRGVRFAADVDGLEGPPSGFAARVVALERFVSTKDDPAVFNVKTPIGVFLGAKGDNSTDDYDAIMRTIAAAESYVSGASWERSAVVRVPDGSYKVRAMPKVRVPNIMVIGDGPGSPTGSADPSSSSVYGGTVFKPMAGFTDPYALKVGRDEADYALSGVWFRDFSIDGYALGMLGSTAGVLHQGYDSGVVNVHVARMPGGALYSEAIGHVTTWPKGAYDCWFIMNKFEGCGGYGIRTSPGSTDHIITQNKFLNLGSDAMWLEGSGCHVVNNDVSNCTGRGIYATGRSGLIAHNRVTDTNGGVELFGAAIDGANFNITGNIFRSVSYGGDGLYDGIKLNFTGECRGGTIGPNTFGTLQRNGPPNRMNYCINIANSNARDVVVAEQSYYGYDQTVAGLTSCFVTAPINDLGVNTSISGRVNIPTVASSATVTLPGHPTVKISGTATITSIAAGYEGRVVRLIFTGTASATGLTDGSNLKLAGNLVYTPDDTVTLVCDGTNWFEMCRSVN